MMPRTLFIAVLLSLVAGSPVLAQTCRTEAEVPSTTPASRFQDNGDATVTDKSTGLMWAQCPEGLAGTGCVTGSVATFTWEAALVRARDSGLAGYTDWRLPTIKELSSLIEDRCYDPAINLAVFPNTPASDFWSASPSAVSSNGAWLVHFSYGYADHYYRSYGERVRLVRSEQ